MEYTVGKYNPAELQDKLIYHFKKRNPEKIGIEAYQAQTIIGFNLRAELERKGLYANIEEIKQTGDKETKIRKLIPLYRNGHIFHKVGMDELEHELKRFPKGRHDDCIDALQMLYSMFELHPNTGLSNQSFEIKYDSNGSPIYI
jgi:predicted phage terminase large subunit-like protein